MFKKAALILGILIPFSLSLSAQKALDAKDHVKEMKADKDAKEGWTKIGGIGADFSLLNLINPRSGAGDNRIGFGGLLNYSANCKPKRLVQINLSLTRLAE